MKFFFHLEAVNYGMSALLRSHTVFYFILYSFNMHLHTFHLLVLFIMHFCKFTSQKYAVTLSLLVRILSEITENRVMAFDGYIVEFRFIFFFTLFRVDASISKKRCKSLTWSENFHIFCTGGFSFRIVRIKAREFFIPFREQPII